MPIQTSIRRKTLNFLLLYALFFLVCLACGFYFSDKHHLFFPSEEGRQAIASFHHFLYLPASEIIQYYGMMDASSYIKAALFFSQHGYFEAWTSNAWPPGEPLLIAAIFKLSGQSAYPLKMLFLVISLWALVFTLVYQTLSGIKNLWIKIFLSSAPLYFHFFQAWVFDYGLILSENISFPLFVIAFCLFIQWLEHNKQSYIIGAAAALAILAYFRGYFEIFGQLLIAIGLIYLILNMIKQYFSVSKKVMITPTMRSIIIALIVFSIILIPWRIYQYIHTGSFSWQQLSSSIWQDFWSPGMPYPTSNIPCLIYPDWCQFLYTHAQTLPHEFYRPLTLATFLEHPFEWYFIKIKFFNVFWFGDSNTPTSWVQLQHQPVMLIEGILIFLSGLTTIITCGFLWIKKRLSEKNKRLFQMILLFVIFNMGLFTFFHYEPRYSLYLQVLFIYSPLWLFFGVNSADLHERRIK